MVRLRPPGLGAKGGPQPRIPIATGPPPGYAASAGVRSELAMDCPRGLLTFFQYGAGTSAAAPGCRGGSRGAAPGCRGGTSGAAAPYPISGTTYGTPLPMASGGLAPLARMYTESNCVPQARAVRHTPSTASRGSDAVAEGLPWSCLD